MQLGIFAKTFEGRTAAAVLPQIKAAGFSTTQYNMACSGLPSLPDAIAEDVLAGIAAAAKAADVPICALSATYNMIHPDASVRETGHARRRVLAEAAATLSIPLLTLCTGTRDAQDQWRRHKDNGSAAAWRDLLASMERAAVIAADYSVNLGIEPELANVVSSAARARQLIDEVQSPHLRIVLDPANLFETGTLREQRYIIAQAVDLLGERLAMAHAKDRMPNGDVTTAGKGVLDYPHFLRELRQAAFHGPLVAHGLEAKEAPAVAGFLRRQMDQA
jgi:sugar phosphate isomerase/epimerase